KLMPYPNQTPGNATHWARIQSPAHVSRCDPPRKLPAPGAPPRAQASPEPPPESPRVAPVAPDASSPPAAMAQVLAASVWSSDLARAPLARDNCSATKIRPRARLAVKS